MTVNFREEQAKNIRRTWVLIILLVTLAVLCGYAFGRGLAGSHEAGLIGVGIGATFGVVMTLVAVYAGGSMVLAFSRAHELTSVTDDDERRLTNAVEEMAIASGLPRPRIFLIETEACNAFACGRNPRNAAVAATRGLIKKLDRNELQAVIGHEMGHIRNYDILFTVVVAIMVGVIVMMADMFRNALWYGGAGRHSSSNSKDNSQMVWLLIGILLSILAPLFAMMLQYAVSREREYLADATSVELTRNPNALASALEKVAGSVHLGGHALDNRGLAHLYIVNPIKGASGTTDSVFATHPPMQKRIERLRAMAHSTGA
ncbi:MAG: M48 family metallopeptidase [Planctomycetota bacterium]